MKSPLAWESNFCRKTFFMMTVIVVGLPCIMWMGFWSGGKTLLAGMREAFSDAGEDFAAWYIAWWQAVSRPSGFKYWNEPLKEEAHD